MRSRGQGASTSRCARNSTPLALCGRSWPCGTPGGASPGRISRTCSISSSRTRKRERGWASGSPCARRWSSGMEAPSRSRAPVPAWARPSCSGCPRAMSDQNRPSLTERPIRVLVVDDDETFRFVMERRLRGSGHHVECVASGEAALERLGTAVFDVILLDLRMPGLSGVDTLRRIRETEITAQVVMLTGHPDYDDCVEAMRLGAFHYLRKP